MQFNSAPWRSKLYTLQTVFYKPSSWIFATSSAFILGYILFYFTLFSSIYYGMGAVYAISLVLIQVLIAVFFGINSTLLLEKLRSAASISVKESSTSTIGSIVSVVFSGCALCGISAFSFLGVGAVIAFLPFQGMELKILALGLLVYSINSLLATTTCKLPK